MKAYEINTTAWEQENFFLFTDLTESQVISIIKPIVMAERDGGEWYTNDDLINALMEAYPSNKVYAYQNQIKLISI